METEGYRKIQQAVAGSSWCNPLKANLATYNAEPQCRDDLPCSASVGIVGDHQLTTIWAAVAGPPEMVLSIALAVYFLTKKLGCSDDVGAQHPPSPRVH